MPRCDSSQTYTPVVRLLPSPADLPLDWAAGVSEVSRFSCVKCLGVFWGLRLRRTEQELALSLSLMLPSPLQERRRPDCIFSELNTQPTYSPVYASPCTSRCPTQNSGPSGSLLLSREKFSFSASHRFIPAHCNRDITPISVPSMGNSS